MVDRTSPQLREHVLFRGSEALAAGMVSRRALRSDRFRRLFRDVYTWSTVPVTHEAEALAIGCSDSVPESQMRVHLVLAGLEPVPQHWIEVGGERIALVDLAFPERKLAVEYDGAWRNNEMWALNHDRTRLNQVQAAGWRVVFVTAQLLRTPREMTNQIRSALAGRPATRIVEP